MNRQQGVPAVQVMRASAVKSAGTARLQDELTGALIGLARACAGNPKTENTDQIIIDGLFATLTNVNFNDETLRSLIGRVNGEKTIVVPGCSACGSPCKDTENYDMEKLWSDQEDIRSWKSLILFGIRGVAAYAYHAAVLGYTDEEVNNFLQGTLSHRRGLGNGRTASFGDGNRKSEFKLYGAA